LSPDPEDPGHDRRLHRTRQTLPTGFSDDDLSFDPLAYAGQQELDQSLLRNPYVLAGLAVAASIFLAVLVVIIFGGSGGESGPVDGPRNNVLIDPLTPPPGRGIAAKSISPATVREGPAAEFVEIAPLRSGQEVEVIGRNQQTSWYQIYYPVGSQLKGWVVASALKLPDGSNDKLEIVIATPIPRPTVALPSPTPEPATTATPTIAASPTPAGGPDLTLVISGCQAGQFMVVTLRNAGPVAVTNRQVRVTIATGAGVQGVADSVISLEAGASASLTTNQIVQPALMIARIDLIGAPPDSNPGNNSAQCSGGPGGGPGVVTPVGTLPPSR